MSPIYIRPTVPFCINFSILFQWEREWGPITISKIIGISKRCISSNIVTFDGSGSSQLIVPSISRAPLVKGGRRSFPICFVVKDR